MAQPQAQRDLICPVRGNRAWEFALKKRKKNIHFPFLSSPLCHRNPPSVPGTEEATWVGHEAFTWILFCGMNQAPTATCESFRNAPGPQRGMMTVVDATDKILRLKFQTERIKVTSKTQHRTGKTDIETREAEFYLYKYMDFIHQRWTRRVLLRNYWLQV